MKRVIHKSIVWPLAVFILIGFFQIGEADVLCIGEDGHIEIESNCLPCCNDIETTCEINSQVDDNTEHEEHDDCYNCSDLSLGSPFWSKRYSNIADISISTKPILLLDVNRAVSSNLTIEQSKFLKTFFTFNISPNNTFISSTILRC